ncbi:DGQHR domain-containing protein [Anaerosoma tenue]|uniref:DGQHR domain-containing protein n=1 Tax=Anaerosoma tenue TaxID=2933588 RepID=UPI002260AA63|nr:DGQHR domain-containing protein [Anaerosoma tenue]MCK8115387.1 DGQHR domain-containing protein [Anaerosoma tenue]
MDRQEWLKPLLTDASALKREAAKRRKPFKEVSVAKSDAAEYIDQGWVVVRELKRKTVLRREWPHEERLENRTWLLFYLLGYPEVSSGRNFKIRIERKGADPLWKQIDVFAKDDETVIVAECKSCDQVTRRSLQKDIEEFSSLRGPIADAIRKHYGRDPKLRIIWLFVTSNIVWSKPDRERAAGARINIVTERELRYYLQIADHLKSAARYQFLAEFLKDQRIPAMDGVRVPAVRGKLGGRTFYSFVSTPRQMLKIAFVNHRSLNDPEGAPTYQRLVSRTRLRQISKFLQEGGYFPTNILVNFRQRCRFEQMASDDETGVAFGHLYLPSKYRSAWVIDGQHRLYGYAPLSDRELAQNIMVVAFENLDQTQEANLFVTINHEQKSVPRTLLDDLEGELKWGSDRPAERIGAISARLIGLMNGDIGEALYGRVTQQGIPATEKTCLTVPELKTGLRRSGLVGSSILKGKEYSPGPLSDTADSDTLDRARQVLNGYLDQIAASNRGLWEMGRQGLLCTNTAMQAHFQLLASVIAHMEKATGLAARELEPLELLAEIEDYIDPITSWLQGASQADMVANFKVPFGSGGPPEYYYRLCHMIQQSYPDFEPDGLAKWVESRSEERIAEADRQIKELNILVQKFIFDRFKEVYGPEGSAYWDQGVTDKEIRARAYKKSLDDEGDDRLPLEHYLDFIEYKKIIETRNHWPLFKGVFDIPEPGQKGLSKNLKWMERINELRRIPAHPTDQRSYKVEDFDYLDYMYGELTARIAAFENGDGDNVVSLS